MPTAMDANPEALLGLRIVTLLHRQQKSVYALAKHAGLPVHTVQRICKGEGKQPSVWTIAAMARVLGVSMDELVGLHETKPTPTPPRQTVHGTPASDVSPATQGKVCLRGHTYDGVLCPACEELRQQHQKPKAQRPKRQRPRKTAVA